MPAATRCKLKAQGLPTRVWVPEPEYLFPFVPHCKNVSYNMKNKASFWKSYVEERYAVTQLCHYH
jgi:hypothetical protein